MQLKDKYYNKYRFERSAFCNLFYLKFTWTKEEGSSSFLIRLIWLSLKLIFFKFLHTLSHSGSSVKLIILAVIYFILERSKWLYLRYLKGYNLSPRPKVLQTRFIVLKKFYCRSALIFSFLYLISFTTFFSSLKILNSRIRVSMYPRFLLFTWEASRRSGGISLILSNL